MLGFLRDILKSGAQFEFEIQRQRFHHMMKIDGGFFSPGMDRAVTNRKRIVGNHQVGIDFHLVAKAVTLETGAGGIVEGEQAGFQLRVADAAVTAGELFAEQQFFLLF